MALSSQSGASSGGIIEGINVTPLVDITLVLLTIFMVTAKFVITPAVPLDLPQASHSQQVQAVLTIALTAAGAVWINGQPASLEALTPAARGALQANPQVRAVIEAERRVYHGRIMRVLDILRSVGMDHVAFAAVSPPAANASEPVSADD